MQYIPWIISLGSLVVAILSLAHNANKDKTTEIREDTEKFDSIEKSLLFQRWIRRSAGLV